MNTVKFMNYGRVKIWYKDWFLVAPHIAILNNKTLLQFLDELSKINIHIDEIKNKTSDKIHSYFLNLHRQVIYLIDKIKYLIHANHEEYLGNRTYNARLDRFLSVDAITGDDYPLIYIKD